MKKAPLYSRSRLRPTSAKSSEEPVPEEPVGAAPPGLAAPPRRSRVRGFIGRHRFATTTLAAVLLVGAGALGQRVLIAPAAAITQEHIDLAVRSALEKEPLPSPYAK